MQAWLTPIYGQGTVVPAARRNNPGLLQRNAPSLRWRQPSGQRAKRVTVPKKRLRKRLQPLADAALPKQDKALFRVAQTHRGQESDRDDIAILGYAV